MKEGLDGGCGWLVVGLMEPGIEMVTGRLVWDKKDAGKTGYKEIFGSTCTAKCVGKKD